MSPEFTASNGAPRRRRAPLPSSRRVRDLVITLALVSAAGFAGMTLRHRELNEPFFMYSAYYVLSVLCAVYLGFLLSGMGGRAWLKDWLSDHRWGIVVTTIVSVVVLTSIEPSFRVLADEANLVGVSKNLAQSRTADFSIAGKWYFDAYWSLASVTDRRPALFPFLVSLIHVIRGYHPENAFYANAALFVLFVFSSYRLARLLGGELFAVAAAILVASNPIVLVSARSAGFDLLATLMLLLVIKSFVVYARRPSARHLAHLTLNLCLLTHVRYEGWAVLLVSGCMLLLLRMVRWSHFHGYGLLYSMVPWFLLPRYWQTIAKAHDAEQPLSASLFSLKNLIENGREYLAMLKDPLDLAGPHSPMILILAIIGFVLILTSLTRRLMSKQLSTETTRNSLFILAMVGMEVVICFTYFWGKAMHPSSARLFLWLDTTLAFAAAWLLAEIARLCQVPLAVLGRRSGAPVAVFSAGALFVMHVPAASDARFVNTLILTRDAAATWKYFESLHDRRILVLSDRPGLLTIMNYGALDISSAKTDRSPLLELSRHLYQNVYLVQQVDLNTHKPLPAFDVWPDVPKETMLEFQSTASSSIRIARIKH